jgi:hypothetical protein
MDERIWNLIDGYTLFLFRRRVGLDLRIKGRSGFEDKTCVELLYGS